MQIQWDNSLNTGHPVVDSQHQELFRRICILIDACREGEPRESVETTLIFIANYVIEHFATEEKLLLEYNFPDAEEHMAEHREFMNQVDRLRKLFELHGADYSLAIDTISTIFGWIGQHIHGRDKSLCRFIQEQNDIRERPNSIVHPLDLSK
jgi:hemerythrin